MAPAVANASQSSTGDGASSPRSRESPGLLLLLLLSLAAAVAAAAGAPAASLPRAIVLRRLFSLLLLLSCMLIRWSADLSSSAFSFFLFCFVL
jgi:hypothetical protein